MEAHEALLSEIRQCPRDQQKITAVLLAHGYRRHYDEPVAIARAHALANVFLQHHKHIYQHDRIAGSLCGAFAAKDTVDPGELSWAEKIVGSYGSNHFVTNKDHFAPDYETILNLGIEGLLARIAASKKRHSADPDWPKKQSLLQSMQIVLEAFSEMICQYGQAADHLADSLPPEKGIALRRIGDNCRAVCRQAPVSFAQALQLIWLVHTGFLYEDRYAMALGRLDQLLDPFYRRDVSEGRLTRRDAVRQVACMLAKISEYRQLYGHDDVVNIAIAGLKPDGSPGLNAMSGIILEAVGLCRIPGPNLSARIYPGIDTAFFDQCLQVMGTGLGYPALMNDAVNIPALQRHGYALEDCRNYAMVGCIENFIPGSQPPWSDGRFNVPKYLELALNQGRCMQTGARMGPKTADPALFGSLDDLISAFEQQLEHGAAEYMMLFRNENNRYNREAYSQPFLSVFCRDCIDRARDINDGGALYPSVHGACCMGIATVADSLAAVESIVFQNQACSMQTLREALLADFQGYETLRRQLLQAPKYGNNDDRADCHAVWYVGHLAALFDRYRTPDGGPVYIGIAANIQNISAGACVAATADGRRCGEPLSDAASPMAGRDREGPTAVMLSTSKPDFTRVSCGSVLNQKFEPVVFREPESRKKLMALIQVYFKRGGQQIQINAVSRELLQEAINQPEQYRSLVTRVSGFSAYYTTLDPAVQLDILNRTEHR